MVTGVTVRDAILQAVESLERAAVWTPRLDAEVLLAHVLGQDRTWLFVHPEETLGHELLAAYGELVARRCEREPVAYIIGSKEFMSLSFHVDRRVMIPRPETETLVEWATAALRREAGGRSGGCGGPGRGRLVADVGTGSGAIAVSVAAALPDVAVVATDISRDALDVARINVERHGLGGRVRLVGGPFLEPLRSAAADGCYDAILSNPPYVPSSLIEDLPREITYEPRLALDGGSLGLDFYAALVPDAGQLIKPGGFLALEVGHGQAEAVCELARRCSWVGRVETVRDLSDVERVVVMWKPGPDGADDGQEVVGALRARGAGAACVEGCPSKPAPDKQTLVLKVNPDVLDGSDMEPIRTAASILAAGGLVCFPTETVYGLGANALDPEAVGRIFKAKGRPQDNPLIVHVASKEQVRSLVAELPPVAARAMEAFWPGPLTLVVRRSAVVPDVVSAGLPTVAVRMPDHGVALALIARAGVPVAAPSANLSGRPSPTLASHVLDDLRGRVDCVLDGGPCGYGVESTVLDVTGPVPLILRPGAATLEALRQALGPVEVAPMVTGAGAGAVGAEAAVARPPSPGLKYTHYAPRAEVTVVAHVPSAPERWARLVAAVRAALARGSRVGIVADEPTSRRLEHEFRTCGDSAAGASFGAGRSVVVRSYGRPGDTAALAARLFALLREFDDLGVGEVVAPLVPEEGLGFAVNNRLRKAARRVVG